MVYVRPVVTSKPVVVHKPVRRPVAAPAAVHVDSRSVVAMGRLMAAAKGWTGVEWDALYQLWTRESGWSTSEVEPSSGACGIPQRHPCDGLNLLPASAQIAWGLAYIAERYGHPCAAWAHSNATGWY